MDNILLFLADGFEEIEAITAIDIIRRGEIEVITVSINKTLQVKGSHGIIVLADELIEDVNFNDSKMLILPGGMPGTLNLEKNIILKEKIELFHKNRKYIAAICAAPSILGKLGILDGKKAVSYPSFEKFLYGATIGEKIEMDGNIITATGVGTAIDFALNIVEIFKGKDKSDEIKAGILYKR